MNSTGRPTIAKPNGLFLKHVLRKVFLEDWVLKLTALVITVALWLGVTGLSTPTTKRFSVPLVMSIPNNTEITNEPIEEVDIVLTGDKRKIDQINRAELTAVVDLGELATGDRVLQLTPENVAVPQLPLGVKLDEVQPSRIAVRLEKVVEKDVEVRAELTGQPAENFEVYAATVNPVKVRVRGPESYIRTLDFLSTSPIDIGGAAESLVARQVAVSVANPNTIAYSTVVDVYVDIGEKRIERMYSVPVKDGEGRARVVLFGGRSIFDELAADDLRVETIKSESGAETPRVVLPQRLEGKLEVRSVRIRG